MKLELTHRGDYAIRAMLALAEVGGRQLSATPFILGGLGVVVVVLAVVAFAIAHCPGHDLRPIERGPTGSWVNASRSTP